MNHYLLYSFTKVTWMGIVGSFGALKGLREYHWHISEESDIENWFDKN